MKSPPSSGPSTSRCERTRTQRKHDRFTRRLDDLKEKEKDLKKKVDEIKAMLVEYEEDVRVSERPAPTPPVATSTNATEGL